MLSFFVVLVALSLGAYLAFSPRLAGSARWKATVTPLASIMGSGFLVSAPLLGGVVGNLSVVCMAGLLALAYAVGGAIRFNIRRFEPIENDGHGPVQIIGLLSRVALAGAYFITVTYYLQLLAAFSVNALGGASETVERGITSALLAIIGGVGMWRGLSVLERLEKYAVALNLGMIGGLLAALAVHNAGLFAAGHWALPNVSSNVSLHDARVLLGLLIVVQGFETSRYLGEEHPADQRIATMRDAQRIAAVVYLLFIGMVTVLFKQDMEAEVTAIVGMTRPLALVLPALISIAAIGSQFSAAVADTEGAGGLIEDLTHERLRARYAYLLILLITVGLTWVTNVNHIIAYASRAFALYYTLQCIVAFLVAWRASDLPCRTLKLSCFASLAVVCLTVFLFGLPAE